jgi:hypothetical protein
MAQHDYNIANASFPTVRSDINDVLSAINTSNSGSSRPSGAVAGTIWLDTSGGVTAHVLKFYDGGADIPLATINTTANTVDFTDSTVTFDIVNDTSPQLGGNLDTNSQNIVIDDAHGILDENNKEQIVFQTTADAVNQLDITNAATSNAPQISATGDDTNIDLKLTPKGSGKLNLDGIKFPNADGSADQILKTNGSGVLSFADASGGGTDWQAVITASTKTAVAGEGYFINTTSNVCTLTLPAGTLGNEVSVIDYAGTFDTNNLTVAANGSEKIQGDAADLTVATERAGFTLVYTDATQGWLLRDK